MENPLILVDTSGNQVRCEIHKTRNGTNQLFIGRGDSDLIIIDEDDAVKLADFIMRS